jgi:Fur family ferric uptake transcriptional regulator
MEEITKKIQQEGYRLTSQRQQIIDALTSSPQSVLEIISFLKSKGVSVDKVTIYRTLDCFVKLGIAAKTQFKDKTAKYELLTASNHHHHLVCDQCGSVEDIPLDDSILLKRVRKQTDFQIKSHSLEFFGICANCQ